MSLPHISIYNKTHSETFQRILRKKNIEIQNFRTDLINSRCKQAYEKRVYGENKSDKNIPEREANLEEMILTYKWMLETKM